MSEPVKARPHKRASARAGEQAQPPVRTSVPLPFDVHVRLTGLAALQGRSLGDVAAEFIEAGVSASGVRLYVLSASTGTTEQEEAA
jgi:hypothetical protein